MARYSAGSWGTDPHGRLLRWQLMRRYGHWSTTLLEIDFQGIEQCSGLLRSGQHRLVAMLHMASHDVGMVSPLNPEQDPSEE